MNKNDSEQMTSLMLQNDQYVEAKSLENADILIFNSCAVRETAENRMFARMKDLVGRRKKAKKAVTLVLAGCVPQYEKESLLKAHPYIDIIVGANSMEYLPSLLDHNSQTPQIMIKKNKDTSIIKSSPKRTPFDQAFIPIMFGCDNFCSYCIVPYTRGREVSRTKESILEEINALAGSGYKKLLLLGQNVNSYGQSLYSHYDFADLLVDIHETPFIDEIDFMTSHPKDMSDKLISTLARLPKMGKEIHCPLQAGDDELLLAMNRHYSVADYIKLVTKIRKEIPDALISTDLIVGFPGETEAQFQNTVHAVKTLGFHRVIAASYSPRKGTAAANLPNQIAEKTKKRRLLELQKAVQQYAFGKHPVEESKLL